MSGTLSGWSCRDWSALGRFLGQIEKGVQWWVGDWWAFGEHRYGDRAKAAAEGIFGRAFQTMADAAWVARRFETSRRREVLPWSHHREVAALPPEQADALLDEAEAEGWNRRELRQRVSQVKVAERTNMLDSEFLIGSVPTTVPRSRNKRGTFRFQAVVRFAD